MSAKTLKLVLPGLAAVLALSVAVRSADDPFVGTWKLNFAKSKYDPGPPPKSQVIKFKSQGDGIKSVTEMVYANGNKYSATYTAYHDGKDYSFIGLPDYDSTALKRINANAVDFVNKKGGKVVRTGRREVSKDGKDLTITSTGTNAKGQAFKTVAVYDKQ